MPTAKLDSDSQLLPVPRTPALRTGIAPAMAATALALTLAGCADHSERAPDPVAVFDGGVVAPDQGPADAGPATFDAGRDAGPRTFDGGARDLGPAVFDAGVTIADAGGLPDGASLDR